MSIITLIEKSKTFDLPKEIIEDRENGRKSFVEKFPLEEIKNLTIDQYVQGTDKNSFCYWLEFKKILFGIGGGNASKFGLYKSKDSNYYTGNAKSKIQLAADELNIHFDKIIGGIVEALTLTEKDKIEEIKELDIPIWNMVLQKILSLYYPDKFITIGASNILIDFANDIDLQNVDLSPNNLIEINYECKKALDKVDPFNNWEYEKVGNFIWENFHPEKEKKRAVEKNITKYWLYAAGENAEYWDEFHNLGIMGLGWDKLGDLNQYTSKEEIVSRLQELENTNSSKKNDATANFEFKEKVSVGDIVIVKRGRGELLGLGTVKSDYFYDANRDYYQKCRKVDWQLKGVWKVDHSLAMKTLTDITNYSTENPSYSKYYETLLAIMDESQTNFREPFTAWLIEKHKEESGTVNSYLRALDLLSEMIGYDIFKSSYISQLDLLYDDLKKEQKNKEGKYFNTKAPSYGNHGYYSASVRSYSNFLIEMLSESDHHSNCIAPLNTIFYGPPGTGKTYHTVLRAAEIVENRKIESYEDAFNIFKSNLHDRIEFITFHQNYSYEDFIQGLRPDTENDKELTFERKDGVFKIIADRALKNIIESEKPIVSKKPFEEVFNQYINPMLEGEVEEIEVKMKKVSYFITAILNKSIDFRKASGGTAHSLSIGTLKKMYDAESVLEIQGLAPYYSPLLNELLNIGKDPEGRKEQVAKKNYVIVIDEINRANISRVFGELITLIEPDKRSHGAIPMEARLPSGDSFVVPSNLYIIGTMNTADKSIALLDIALRRRFEFESMYPKYEINDHLIYDVEILQSINNQIIKSKGHDFQIGHAYFMGDNNDLVQRMNKKVIPLLLEYYMNDEKEVKGILSNAGLQIEEGSWPIRITG